MPFSCVIIGRGPQATACADILLGRGHQVRCMISNCATVAAWTQKHGVTRLDPSCDLPAALGPAPFEYLFSIVNHAITPASVLALPTRAAVNYHDSPLPAYGGFNATAWAILQGESQHGVTWHRMTDKVDAGATMLQRSIPILDDDTAFSLATRCGDLAVRSFSELLQGLEKGELPESPGQPVHNFHFKSDRPALPVLSWQNTARDLGRLVRGLDFGTEENWMSRARLLTPESEFLCVGTLTPGGPLPGLPGTVARVDAQGVAVVVQDGSVVLSDLTSIDGAALRLQELQQLGVTLGAVLPQLEPAFAAKADAFDRAVTKTERYWLKKLVNLAPSLPSECKPHGASGVPNKLRVPLPVELSAAAPSQRQAAVTTALAAYMARVGDEVTRVDVGLVVDELSRDLRPLYASVVPLSVAVSVQTPWADLKQRSEHELQEASERKTYARDIYTRYASLRGKSLSDRTLPLALASSPWREPTLPVGVVLLLCTCNESNELELVFDAGALTSLHAQRLAARLVHILATAVTPLANVASLSVVTPEEQDLLLRAFQDTDRPAVQIACIHELIAAQAARTPHATALIFRDQRLTYAQVEARANALAHHLCTLGVGPDALVAVCIERSLDMVIGMLAILKAGGAYVPLDPAYPQERLAIMLEDSGARWLLTQSHLASALPRNRAEVVLVGDVNNASANTSAPVVGVKPEHLAYVIFTSGSTGRPKGVMVEHRNVANFFAGMDERVGTGPGHWLAVTSISFDISVLEIFWTLARGFETVIQEEGDRASLLKAQGSVTASSRPMGFGLFYFAADSRQTGTGDAYKLLLDGARFADTHGFTAVWTPERHFHEFGGLYPNPAVTSAAVAAITSHIAVRAGSVVIPLHDPIRVAEEWAMVDNLSGGRVGLSFASGWHANDFALKPENYEHRQDVMRASIDTVLRLWAGEKISVKNGLGETVQVSVLPRPVRARPPMWIASAGNIETFRTAGRLGYNVLTNMLGQDYKDLAKKFAAYREARQEAGHDDQGIISVMLHTFVTDDDEKARQLARVPFGNYLKSSYDLVKVAPWMFPAFKRPARQEGEAAAAAPTGLDENDMAALLDHAFDRYFDTAGLFGTPARALRLIEQLKDIGATEVACLIDFGIDPQTVLANLVHLDDLRRLANPTQETQAPPPPPISIREQFENHRITHFQCTPSMARILIADGTIAVMASLEKLLVGGEAMPADLAATLSRSLPNTTILNMYGPTETTVWSTCASIGRNDEPITIGTPIANTQIRLLDSGLGLAPLGTPAELCIGGASVVRGYLNQPDLTAARFIADPFSPTNRLYRTGDLARYRDDGAIEYIGRMDQQVKVNGYRIELGEIETILNRHSSVKEAVVAVKHVGNSATLVGYVITTGDPGGSTGSDAVGHLNVHVQVNDWQHRWDQAYSQRAGATSAPARFNTSGWLSSYTGEPLPESDMRQWLDETVSRILALQPKRVLEIGCGTGMLLYACLPQVSHYTALDLSPFALESIRAELTSEELAKVTLLNQAAHELKSFDDHSIDLVIINSVAQYFPSAAYLLQVLEQAARVLVDGGNVFLGDVRSLQEAAAFSTLVELHKAPGQMPAAKLGARIEDRTASEAELLLATSFFAEVNSTVPQLSCAKIALKRGQQANEMRDFRYDVILRAGAQPALHEADLQQVPAATSLPALRAALLSAGDLTVMKGLPNARLAATYDALAQIRNQAAVTVQDLRQALSENHGGFDPDEVLGVSADHDVELRFGTAPGTFDALFRRKGSPTSAWPIPPATGAHTANTPQARTDSEALVPKLKAHIRDFLPEYMIPQTIVFLQAFPLTPNGKIDRKALPQPTVAPSQAAAEFAVPSNDLERTIADIWRDMLGIERVGRKDNIFDLGASSLLTVEANGRLQTALGRKIPLVTMFRYPTVETLAAHLGKSTAATPGQPTPADNASGDQERDSRLAAAAERRRQARTRSS